MYFNSFMAWNSEEIKFEANLKLLNRIGYQGTFINVFNEKEYRELINSEFFSKNPPELSFPLEVKSLTSYSSKKSPILVFPRVTLEPKSASHLKQELARWVSRRCLIAVQSTDKEILEVAARDGRVDMITFPSMEYFKDISKGILSLLKQNRIFIDLHFNELITSYGNKRTRILRNLYKLFKQAKPLTYSYLISLGTHPSKTPFQYFRGPRELGAILISLLELPEVHAKQMLRENGEQLAILYLKRDQKLFIQPGVEIINKKLSQNEQEKTL